MNPARPKIAGLAFLISAILAQNVAWGSPSLIRGETKALKRLSAGQSARVTVQTPDGLQELVLRRHFSRQPVQFMVNNVKNESSSSLIRPALFQGRLLKRQNQASRSKLSGVAADLYRGKIRIHFYGRRSTRLYTVTSDLEGSPSQAQISHLPASYPIPCANESSVAFAHSSANVGRYALISSGRSRRIMELALDADYEYYQANNYDMSDTNAEIEAVVNILDGIYSDQLAVSVTLNVLNVFTSPSQPYTTSNAEDLLDSLASYRNTTPFSTNFDAAQLLTGKVMYVPGYGTGIVGISYLSIQPDYSDPGTVCRYSNQYSYTVVERVGSSTTYSAILTAHEIGHNLSLFHADSGIMNPAPSPSETSFSEDSAESALAYIEEFGSCLAIVGPSTNLTSARVRSGKFTAGFTINNYANESCKLKVYASDNPHNLTDDYRRHTYAKLMSSKAVTSSAGKNFEGVVGTSSNRTKRKYHLIGELECDGIITSTSETRSISTNLSTFLTKLKAALRKKSAARKGH